jgi:hypothetical protein
MKIRHILLSPFSLNFLAELVTALLLFSLYKKPEPACNLKKRTFIIVSFFLGDLIGDIRKKSAYVNYWIILNIRLSLLDGSRGSISNPVL